VAVLDAEAPVDGVFGIGADRIAAGACLGFRCARRRIGLGEVVRGEPVDDVAFRVADRVPDIGE
jgi:hypothetical protein